MFTGVHLLYCLQVRCLGAPGNVSSFLEGTSGVSRTSVTINRYSLRLLQQIWQQWTSAYNRPFLLVGLVSKHSKWNPLNS